MLSTRIIFEGFYSSADQDLLNAARDAKHDQVDGLAKALTTGAKIDRRDIRINSYEDTIGYYYTALMWAVHNGHEQKMLFLLNRGANPWVKTKHNNNILHIAAREGHRAIIDFLIAKYPQLLTARGEAKLTTDEIIHKYNRDPVTTEAFTLNYTNLYFTNVSMPFGDELVIYLLTQIADPIDFKNLCSVNKAWNSLARSDIVTNIYDAALRRRLNSAINQRDNFTWQSSYTLTFGELTNENKTARDYVRRAHNFYVLGEPISLLVNKNIFEKISDCFAIIPCFFWEGGWRTDKKYRRISYEEVAYSIRLDAAPITAYRSLAEAANVEKYNAEQDDNLYYGYQCKTRQALFQVTLFNHSALRLFNNTDVAVSIRSSEIAKIKQVQFGMQYFQDVINQPVTVIEEKVIHKKAK